MIEKELQDAAPFTYKGVPLEPVPAKQVVELMMDWYDRGVFRGVLIGLAVGFIGGAGGVLVAVALGVL